MIGDDGKTAVESERGASVVRFTESRDLVEFRIGVVLTMASEAIGTGVVVALRLVRVAFVIVAGVGLTIGTGTLGPGRAYLEVLGST